MADKLSSKAASVDRESKIVDQTKGVPEPKYDWRGLTNEWGVRVIPGPHGLRLGDINVGSYGEVPDYWQDQTRRPRGSVGRPGIPPLPYSLRSKHELWAECSADLYEEAIQRRWIPATEVPWDSLKTLPDDIEKAVCQMCTELSQSANTELEIITYWQDRMSYGYFEVKQYLATATFDCARQLEALRKRALSNGGGLGIESRGRVNRIILESSGGWTEAVVYLYLLRGTYITRLLTGLLSAAHNEAEAFIYSHMLEDHARHLTYGYDHLEYASTHHDDASLIMGTLLAVGEAHMAAELKEGVVSSAMAIIFGGGIKGARTHGMERYLVLVRDFINDYLAICRTLGIDREKSLHPVFKRYLEG
ncbi:MAG: hypothetical protein VYA08_14205 [Pseudomonadota bacterium]|nr:hypothetical protein [Pseudomonadota bacterium]